MQRGKYRDRGMVGWGNCFLFAIAIFLVAPVFYTHAASHSVQKATNIPRTDYSAVAAELESFISHEMQDQELPAFSIALVDDQQIVWAKGFGYADPDEKILATADTVYRVGSVSKLFTDIGIMQLVERGKIDLDAPITRYLPDFHPHNPFKIPITLRQLMSHRSGLVREPPVGNYFDPSHPSLAATVRSLNDTTLIYPPGSHTKYSNAGIAVVGLVLQSLSGQDFTSYLQNSLLSQLGLQESAFEPNLRIARHLAKGFMWTYEQRVFTAPTFEVGMAPAASMYSTVTDLGRFLSVLFAGGRGPHGQVIQSETLLKMWTPQFPTSGEKHSFGLGFILSQLDSQRVIEHAGAIYGFSTQISFLPDDKFGVVAITTMDFSNAVTKHVADEALRLMLVAKHGQPLPRVAVTSPIPTDRILQLVGRHGMGDDAVDLTEKNGELYYSRVAGGEDVRLRLFDNTLIEDGRLGYGLKIAIVPKGIQIGDITLKRVPADIPGHTPESWNGLIGKYGWDHDTLSVLVRNRKLTVLIDWFEYDPLDQTSNDVFNLPHFGMYESEQAIFTRETSGKAIQVKVGGVTFERRLSEAISPNPESSRQIIRNAKYHEFDMERKYD